MSQDVCLLCLGRLQWRATRRVLASQKRRVAASELLQRPLATAAAQVQDNDQSQHSGDQSAQPSSLGIRDPQRRPSRLWGQFAEDTAPAPLPLTPADPRVAENASSKEPLTSLQRDKPAKRTHIARDTHAQSFARLESQTFNIRRLKKDFARKDFTPPIKTRDHRLTKLGSGGYRHLNVEETVRPQQPLEGGQWQRLTRRVRSPPEPEAGNTPHGGDTPRYTDYRNGNYPPSKSTDLPQLDGGEKPAYVSFRSLQLDDIPSKSAGPIVPERSSRPHSRSAEEVEQEQEQETLSSGDLEKSLSEQALKRARFPSRRFVEDEPSSFNATPKRRERMSRRREDKFETFVQDEADEDKQERARKERKRKKQQEKEAKAASRPTPIELPPFISVANLASALKIRLDAFMGKLEELGFEEVASDHVLNAENAGLVAMEYNFEPTIDRSETEDLKARPVVENKSSLPQRPPVVTIMGHVDHGKTTLLDYLRKSSVAASEHGGITQHIGAFSVSMASGKLVTFLDTPGHAAFLSMRQRGANVTDIVILVVAADDSVKPQTIEAIKHARAARVPIIVAINKVDKDEADAERVKQDLMRHEIEVEDFGGDVQAIEVSGKTGQGLDKLEEAIVTLAEILDMRAETDGAAEGWVLEATTKKAGRVATVLVRRGTLRPGDIVVAGTTWARVRGLRNEAGVQVKQAGPGTPVEIDGWRDQAVAGDEVLQAPSEQKATSVIQYRAERIERRKLAEDMEAINEARRLEAEKREREKEATAAAATAEADGAEVTVDGKKTPADGAPEVESVAKAAEHPELFFIVKADVSGSVEAITASLESLPLANHNMTLTILRSGVGPVSESDVAHAAAAPPGDGYVVSFNQPVLPAVQQQATQAGVRLLDENIIYKVLDEVKAVVESRLPQIVTSRVTGEAEAAQVFDINVGGRKTMRIVGCRVRNGTMERGKKVKVHRGAEVVYEGEFTLQLVLCSLMLTCVVQAPFPR